MNPERIWAVILRHLYNLRHSWEELSDSFYWPAMDLIIWGLTSQYFQKSSSLTSHLVLILLTGLIFWQVIWRSQYEITVSLLNELWNKNLVNLFTSPLTINEWMLAVLSLGIIKMFLTLSFSLTLVWIFYSINLLKFGFMLVPFFALLLISGWWVGLVVASLIFRVGRQAQTLAWAGVYLLAPFSAVYYPVSSLPVWAQKISMFIPTSYIFEGMRQILLTGVIPWRNFIISLFLNIFYLLLAMMFLRSSFYKAKEEGLAKLDEN
jgi:ABC-2 type transport system permease protein